MRYVYIDSGTTNSRLYLVEDKKSKDVMVKNIGTVNNVAASDPHILTRGLKEAYECLIQRNSLTDGEIDGIYMSGMATSRDGIFEVDFLPVPIDIKVYSQKIPMHYTGYFDRKVGYLTGIVDRPCKRPGDLGNVERFNNVRGEEIELFGIMGDFQELFAGRRTAVIMPGSHTHILYAQDRRITRITSCMGGEMYSAMAGHTILKASVGLRPEELCSEAVAKGFKMAKEQGINRALYLTRTLDLFTEESRMRRDSYLEGVINAGIITALEKNCEMDRLDGVIVAGTKVYHIIFKTLLSSAGYRLPVAGIEAMPGESFALRGFVHMMNVWEGRQR